MIITVRVCVFRLLPPSCCAILVSSCQPQVSCVATGAAPSGVTLTTPEKESGLKSKKSG